MRLKIISFLAGVLLLSGCGWPAWYSGQVSLTGTKTAVFHGAAGTYQFTALDFLNQAYGWVAATGSGGGNGPGRLYHTTDGGNHWVQSPLPPNPVAVSFGTPDKGLLITQDFTAGSGSLSMYSTADGGKIWRKEPHWGDVGSPVQLRLLDGNVGFLEAGRFLLKTVNGGQHWSFVRPGQGLFTTSFDFLTPLQGYVTVTSCYPNSPDQSHCGYGLEYTGDGGATFQSVYRTQTPIGSVDFVNSQQGWLFLPPAPGTVSMGGREGSLLGTRDGGKTWVPLQSEAKNWEKNPLLYPPGFQGDLVFTSGGTGWVPVGGGAGSGMGGIQVTTDGGKTFVRRGADRQWSIQDVSLLCADDGWAIGTNKMYTSSSFLLHSSDGGESFSQVLPVPFPSRKFQFLSASVGYGLGLASDPGALVRTVDGGHTWHLLPEALTANIDDISFSGAMEGYAVAGGSGFQEVAGENKQSLWLTENGGDTWTRVNSSLPTGTLGIDFFPGGQGILSTQWAQAGPALWSTTDDGKTFKKVALLPAKELNVTDAVAPGDTWVVATQSLNSTTHWDPNRIVLWRSTGGKFRQMQTFPSNERSWYAVDGLSMDSHGHGRILVEEMERADKAVKDKMKQATYFPTTIGLLILSTDDGGHHWTPIQLPTSVELGPQSILQFTGPNTGYLNANGGLFRTSDGGLNWTRLS